MSASENSFVELYRAANAPDAYLLVHALADAGIQARVENEFGQLAAGELPMGWAIAPRVMVTRSDFEAAQAVVAAHRQIVERRRAEFSRGDADDLCIACGATMNGAATCPACGWSSGDSAPANVANAHDSLAATVSANPYSSATHAVEPLASLPLPPTWKWELAAVLCLGVFWNLLNATQWLWYAEPVKPSALPLAVETLYGVLYAACDLMVMLFVFRISEKSLANWGLTRWTWWDLPFGIAVFITCYFSAIVSQRMFDRVGWPPLEIAYRYPSTALEYSVFALHMAGNSCAEEFICRAYLITRLRDLCSPAVAVLLSAFAFASYHFTHGGSATIGVFVIGIVYGCWFLGLRTVWPLVIGHTLYNIFLTMLGSGR